MSSSNTFSKLILGVASLAIPAMGLSESGISTGPATGGSISATARVDLCVVVPKVLVFKVGDYGKGTPGGTLNDGDALNKVEWTVRANDNGGPLPTPTNDAPYVGPAPFDQNDVDTSMVADDDTTSTSTTDGVLNVYAFSNNGDITIVSSASNGAVLNDTTNTYTIPLTDFAGAGASHPSSLNGGTAGTVTANASNIAELPTTTEWTYTYTPTTTPAAGTYETTITYTASIP